MKLDHLSRWLALLANIGVVAGIVFLAIELRQNNALMEAESRAASFNNRLMGVEKLTEPEITRVLAKVAEGEELSLAEALQLYAYHTMVMESWEWMYEESNYGLVDMSGPEIASAFRKIPGLVEYWENQQYSAPPEFVQWFQENVVDER